MTMIPLPSDGHGHSLRLIDGTDRVEGTHPQSEETGDTVSGNGLGDDSSAGIISGRSLPGDFWTARESLGHIRQAAHSRQRSADAVLHVVLARITAGVPYTVQLPAIVGSVAPLCYFAQVLGPSGTGKGCCIDIGTELVPLGEHVADNLPLGTGEGIVEILFDMVPDDPEAGQNRLVKKQVRHNAFVSVDEGDMLTIIGARSGASILSTLRSIWSGKLLGSTNATKERTRIVLPGQYTYGVVVGLQDAKAGALLDDAPSGTPQRFAWCTTLDPSVPDTPPAWPGPLRLPALHGGASLDIAQAVQEEIRRKDRARVRGQVTEDLFLAHADLLRLKIAALLGVLDGRLDINEDDWVLAGEVKAASDANVRLTRGFLADQAAHKEHLTSTRLAQRQVKATAAVEGYRSVQAAHKIRDLAKQSPGITVSEARRKLRRWRAEFDDGLAIALSKGSVTERIEPGRGQGKRTLYPGGTVPRHDRVPPEGGGHVDMSTP